MERDRYAYQSETVRQHIALGRELGIAEGWAKGVLIVLETRGIEVSQDIRRRILECTDLETLEGWLRRAAVITETSQLIAET